jgi:hypothetical protein
LSTSSARGTWQDSWSAATSNYALRQNVSLLDFGMNAYTLNCNGCVALQMFPAELRRTMQTVMTRRPLAPKHRLVIKELQQYAIFPVRSCRARIFFDPCNG